MTEQEKQAMLAFLGTVHAQAKQTDQMIVGQSNFVKPVSHAIQNEFAQVLAKPVNSDQASYQHIQPPVVQPQPEQPLPTQEVQVIPTPQEDQLMFTFEAPKDQEAPIVATNELVEVLKDINLNLHRIGSILEEKNKSNARNKNSKKE
jgi:hypothetical protein